MSELVRTSEDVALDKSQIQETAFVPNAGVLNETEIGTSALLRGSERRLEDALHPVTSPSIIRLIALDHQTNPEADGASVEYGHPFTI